MRFGTFDVAKSAADATLGRKRGNEAEETPSTPPGRPVKRYKLVEACPPPKKNLVSHPAMAAQLGFFKLKGSPKRKAGQPRRLQTQRTGT